MIKSILCAAAFSALAFGASAATITNGDFETGDLSGWTVGTTSNGETGVSGVSIFDTGGFGASDAASFRVGQIDFDRRVNEGITLSQTISILSEGVYSFAAEVAALGGSSRNSSGGVFELLVDDTLLDIFDTESLLAGDVERDTLVGEIFLGTGPVDLTIRITRPFLQTANTPTQYVDNVTVSNLSTVPLPAGLPLLAIGLGSLVWIRRKS
ncbi:MAG: VPLPA-CTERM sorting domain-containing protein [Pseudomonadota bacterium]